MSLSLCVSLCLCVCLCILHCLTTNLYHTYRTAGKQIAQWAKYALSLRQTSTNTTYPEEVEGWCKKRKKKTKRKRETEREGPEFDSKVLWNLMNKSCWLANPTPSLTVMAPVCRLQSKQSIDLVFTFSVYFNILIHLTEGVQCHYCRSL